MSSAMRLMLLLLACLMVGQATAARNLQVAADPTKRQFLQVAVTFSGKCSDVDAARLLRDNLVADVKAYFVGAKKQSIADSVTGRLDTVCQDIKEGTSDLAGFRSAVRWVGLDNRDDQTRLFRGAKRNACDGGISPALYSKLLAAAKTAKYTIKYNQAGQWNPNIARGPIPYVDATNCEGPAPPPPPASPTPASPAPTPASPTPASPAPASPAPASPAPASPAPASPAPAPASPSPAPLDCSALVPNSVADSTGNCVCTAPGFLVPAYNGTTLAACLATGAACPTAYPIPAKDGSGAVQQCLVNINTCPTQYPFFLVAGDSGAIVECRPVGSACTFTGFGVQISDSTSGNVVGCAKSDGQCPSAYPVAYRESSSSFQLTKCDNAASCPKFDPAAANPVPFTVNARTASGQLVGCFTLDYLKGVQAGTCPALTAVNFPINVVGTDPDTAGGTVKTLTCLAPNSTCPSSNPIQLYASTIVGAAPTVVTCALLNVLVNNQCPGAAPLTGFPVNVGPYPVRIGPSDQLIGCSASTSTCPVAYPFPTVGANGISSCSPTGSTTTCDITTGQVSAVDVAGNTVACLGVINQCPTNYPIEVRDGNTALLQCLAQGASCPTTGPSTFPYYAAAKAGDPAILKQCRPKPTVDSCINAGFLIPIYTNDNTTNANLVGCVDSSGTTTVCPAAYPVPYQDNTLALKQCRPTSITACPSSATGLNFPSKVVDATGKTVACIVLPVVNGAPVCPSTLYTVSVKQVLINQDFDSGTVVQCMPRGTVTCPSAYPFTIFDDKGVLQGCIPNPGAADCNNAIFGQTYGGGISVYGPSGSPLLGCLKPGATACPSPYISFWTTAGLQQCRTKLGTGTTCLQAEALGTYPISGRDKTGAVVACIDAAATCTTVGYTIPVAPTVPDLQTNPTDCLTPDATCPATVVVNGQSKPAISLYSGVSQNLPNSVAALVGCTAIATGANGAPLPTCATGYIQFQFPVYSDAAGFNLVGCTQFPTPCPVNTVAILPEMGVLVNECRGGRTDCTFPSTAGASGNVYSTYKVLVKDTAGTLRGCQEQSPSTSCPFFPAGPLAADYSFPLFGPDSNNAAVVKECRPVPVPAVTCAGTIYGVDYPVNISPAALVGCMVAGTTCPALNRYSYITPAVVNGAASCT